MRYADKISHDNLFCEWATGGPVILVWNWCPMNGREKFYILDYRLCD